MFIKLEHVNKPKVVKRTTWEDEKSKWNLTSKMKGSSRSLRLQFLPRTTLTQGSIPRDTAGVSICLFHV